MSYRVCYEGVSTSVSKNSRLKSRKWLAAAVLFGLFLGTALLPSGRGLLGRIFLPGDPAVTGAALEAMVRELKDGEPLGQAVESFCVMIMNDPE